MKRLVALLVLSGCTQAPPQQAKFWTAPLIAAGAGKSFAGFSVSRLAVKAGATPTWRSAEYGGPVEAAPIDGFVSQPAWSNGEPSAYVVTEIWEHHPEPWIQPVYQFVKPFDAVAPGTHRTGADGLFGLGVESTFYSPFWRLWWAEPGDAVAPYRDVDQVAGFPQHKGPMVVCPIVPPGMGLVGTTHPFTGAPLQTVNIAHAWASGERVDYLDLGGNRQAANEYEAGADGTVTAAEMYFFASISADASRTLVDLPAVLPENPSQHAFVRRVDVVLDNQAVFVPASLSELRAKVGIVVNVPAADPAIPDAVARRYLLKVAKDGACFMNAALFPQGCTWLDTPAAIAANVPPNRIFETEVTLTATAVLLP
ncbi:MAG: hypothetical protein IPJ65_12105 [Archangiaceae bacterium]|nr:hypothetical protein [Archangiaceae bacterium]